jgi:hypothetical protein
VSDCLGGPRELLCLGSHLIIRRDVCFILKMHHLSLGLRLHVALLHVRTGLWLVLRVVLARNHSAHLMLLMLERLLGLLRVDLRRLNLLLAGDLDRSLPIGGDLLVDISDGGPLMLYLLGLHGILDGDLGMVGLDELDWLWHGILVRSPPGGRELRSRSDLKSILGSRGSTIDEVNCVITARVGRGTGTGLRCLRTLLLTRTGRLSLILCG